ncbi:sodium/proton antiporter NhaB [Candidatus Pantoea edessiphila]|uniref:Na(+)/H(+) antiporter NhaB n=1 Tax=Candidatus Pantoea edessiphila TaxID=2044610 RepID=A0A2P5SYP1_9GAMM|nr:sodium/proton antiporter NhaB [Candidatus Pantoea edessiphila]MBK4775425.1 sodium/proton antiporter NhaB [Pantoea sp. Edef]PPI87445.1 sodium/proton antiporter NhaB [Candidatus Pantoea edessiphila]
MDVTYLDIVRQKFLGKSPNWYKLLILIFLIINPVFYLYISSYVAAWFLVIEFIFTLSMSLKCYPLLPGGLLSLEAIMIGMSSSARVKIELYNNIEVLLLLIFMVSAIFFIKKLLLFCFTKLILRIDSKTKLAVVFCLISSLLSAFIDALTVLAVIITVFVTLYKQCKQIMIDDHQSLLTTKKAALKQFRSFLRSLVMHAGIGTALGGIMTMIGEPQNLIIAHSAEWNFVEFILRMLPISISVFIAGICTVFILEHFKLFGYGATIPTEINKLLKNIYKNSEMGIQDKIELIIQGLIIIWLLISLIFQFSEAGLIGLSIIIISTSFLGITDEQDISRAFTEALPFASLLIVFCAITAVIFDQKIFVPIINFILHFDSDNQLKWLFIFNGFLSSIADNVFIGTVYISELKHAFEKELINHHQFELLAIVVNVGTNIPSIATPNGQASFLFLLTSNLSSLINLSYKRMVMMALPFSLILSAVAYCCIKFFLSSYTNFLINSGLIISHNY